MEKIKIQNQSLCGGLWLMGWLFTLGFLDIEFFWKGVLAVILWPYYLGQAISPLFAI